jgi:hypothetical protein
LVQVEVLRLRILTSSRDTHPGEAEEFCLERGVAAVGWPVARRPSSWDDYRELALDWYSQRELNTVERLVRAPTGTLVWFRDREGVYHLGELHGLWHYDSGPDAARLDIANQRPCRWQKVGPALDVPGAVVRAFTGPGPAVRRVANESVGLYSRALMDGRVPAEDIPLEVLIRDLLDDTDVEDLVALYLQHVEGVVVVPPDRQRGHPGYDLEFVAPGARRGLVQVKSGEMAFDFDSLPADQGERWAYVASGRVSGEGTLITTAQLAEFMTAARDWLPGKLRRWIGSRP